MFHVEQVLESRRSEFPNSPSPLEVLEQAQRAHSPELCSGVSERITNISSPIEDSPKLCFAELQCKFTSRIGIVQPFCAAERSNAGRID